MLWSLITSRRMAAAVWPLRCRDADVQRSASPSGSGRRPRGRRRRPGRHVKTQLWLVGYFQHCCCFFNPRCQPKVSSTRRTAVSSTRRTSGHKVSPKTRLQPPILALALTRANSTHGTPRPPSTRTQRRCPAPRCLLHACSLAQRSSPWRLARPLSAPHYLELVSHHLRSTPLCPLCLHCVHTETKLLDWHAPCPCADTVSAQ